MARMDRGMAGGRRGMPGLILGLAIVAFGLALTLDNLNLLDVGSITRFWPVLVVLAGLAKLSESPRAWRDVNGWVWVALGFALQLHVLDLVRIHRLWPLVFVFVGLSMVLRRRDWGECQAAPASSADSSFSALALMGGVNRGSSSSDFRGGSVTAVMGGCEIDLRQAKIAAGVAEIEVFAFWGGVEITVPPEWTIDMRGWALLAGFDDQTKGGGTDGQQRLVVSGLAIMAGVEIKH